MVRTKQPRVSNDPALEADRPMFPPQPEPSQDELIDIYLHDADHLSEADAHSRALPIPIPMPLPFPMQTSGLYLYERRFPVLPTPLPIPRPQPVPRPLAETEDATVAFDEAVYDEDVSAISFYQREEVRLDVDGRYPQMMISGTRSGLFGPVVHWIARVRRVAAGRYEGPIWYRNGNAAAVPHAFVSARVTGGPFPATRKLEITFTGGGAAAFKRSYGYQSAYHHEVEFEYDRVGDAVAVTSIATHAHPTRPPALPAEQLSIETVFRRAGIHAKVSPGSSAIPLVGAGGDGLWTDQEMHDAMQLHWSRFANKPQWAMWVLFARLHVMGNSLGGIMFDDIGPNHRQGTAIFSHSFIAAPPAGDAAPAAWVQRMRFWTAVHEMGHAFNLAHSWQKALGTPWIPLANEPNARSFMNYPYSVSGGQAAFFQSFDYRFSDNELIFMRHAPSRFVEMGNEAWFSNHGFEAAAADSHPDFELTLSTTRADDRFPYLMPPVVEVALSNRSARTKLVSAARIGERTEFALIINGERQEPKRWQPHLRHCGEGDAKPLAPGAALYDSILIGTGRNGWDMAEPGRYAVQAVLEVDGEPVYSNRLWITVDRPRSREEERLAADFFTPEVGQVLAVNGSRGLDRVRDTLAAATEIENNPVSSLAAVALATPLAYDFKLLSFADDPGAVAAAPQQRIEGYAADPQGARRLLARATADEPDALVDAIGHARFLRDAPLLAALEQAEVPNSPQAFAMFDEGAGRAEAAATLPISAGLRSTLAAKAAGLTE